jgi:hypothetical protein
MNAALGWDSDRFHEPDCTDHECRGCTDPATRTAEVSDPVVPGPTAAEGAAADDAVAVAFFGYMKDHGYGFNVVQFHALQHALAATTPAVPRPVPDLPAGVWRHWKGHLYQVLGYATDSGIAGRTVVVYIGLELDGASPGPRMHVREAAEFAGQVEFNGAMIPRFEYVAPAWPGEVPLA